MFSSDLLAEENAFAETLALQSSLFQISDAHTAVGEHGMNRTSLQLLTTTGLISPPQFGETMAMEAHLTTPEVYADAAMESLVDKFKEKAAAWAGKILTLVKDTGKALLEKIKALGAKIVGVLSDSKDATVAKGKDLQAEVKAHPVKAILAGLTAAAAVIGVVAFATGNLGAVLTASKIPAFLRTLAAMIGKIVWPFGKLVPKVIKDHKIVVSVVAVPAVTTAATIATLGWANQSSSTLAEKIRHVVDSISRGWDHVKEKAAPIASSAGTMAKGIGTGTIEGFKAGTQAAKGNRSVKYHSAGNGEQALGGAMLAGVFGVAGAAIVGGATVLVSVLHILYHLIKVIVFGTLNMISSSVHAVKGARAARDSHEYV